VSGGTSLVLHDTVVIGDLHFSGNLDGEGLVQGLVFYSLVEKAAGAEVNGSLTHVTDADAIAQKAAANVESSAPADGFAPMMNAGH